jgi:hypothetical protein
VSWQPPDLLLSWTLRRRPRLIDGFKDLNRDPFCRRLAIDTEEVVAAEVAAALRISQSLAGSRLRYARAMRGRLLKMADVFKTGDIDLRTFQTIVYRTDLIPPVQTFWTGWRAATPAA